jgi:signal peptidase I
MPSAHTCLRSIDRAVTGLSISVALALVVAVAGTFAGYRLLVDVSDSMRPALRAGDLLVTERVPAALIGRGDIITLADLTRGGRLVTHRVVSIKRTGDRVVFTTRGDANPASESWPTTSRSSVQRVRARVPALGRALATLGAIPLPVLLFGVVIAPALLLHRRARTRA